VKAAMAIAILVAATIILAQNWYEARHSREHYQPYAPDRTQPVDQTGKAQSP
jgi:hypothetical protein